MNRDQISQASDESLAAYAARGDRDAQAELVRRFQKPIFSLCLNLVGKSDAEDLAQDCLLRVLTRLESFSGESRLSTWVYRLTTNLCLTHLRRRAISPVSEAAITPETRHAREPPATSSVQTSERSRRLRQALMSLPVDQRLILVLRDVRGLEYEQLTDVLDLPIGTVRSRLFRARRALAQALDDQSRAQPDA